MVDRHGGAGLSAPLFFVSVWIERQVGRRVLVDAAPEAIRRWSWWANGWSYAGLVLFWVGVGVKWAYRRAYQSSELRQQTLDPWLHYYNHHRPHAALGRLPPAARVNNVLSTDS